MFRIRLGRSNAQDENDEENYRGDSREDRHAFARSEQCVAEMPMPRVHTARDFTDDFLTISVIDDGGEEVEKREQAESKESE